MVAPAEGVISMDNKENDAVRSRSAHIMDVQAPRQSVSSVPVQATNVDANDIGPKENAPAESPVVKAPPVEEGETGDIDNRELSQLQSTDFLVSSVPEEASPEASDKEALVAAPGESTHKHHQTPVAPIVLSVTVAIILAIIATFLYVKQAPVKPAPTAQTNTAQSNQADNESSKQVIDDTEKKIDSSLNQLEESPDMGESSIDDTALGL